MGDDRLAVAVAGGGGDRSKEGENWTGGVGIYNHEKPFGNGRGKGLQGRCRFLMGACMRLEIWKIKVIFFTISSSLTYITHLTL